MSIVGWEEVKVYGGDVKFGIFVKLIKFDQLVVCSD